MQKIETEKNTNTRDVGYRAAIGETAHDVLIDNISDPTYTVFGSSDSELQQLAQEPLFQTYADVGPEIYEIISRTNPTLKAAIDLAKEICEGDQ